MRQIRLRRKSVHADGKSHPIEEIRHWVVDLQLPHGQKCRRAKHYTKQRIYNERAHAHEKLRREILRIFVNHVTAGLPKRKKQTLYTFSRKSLQKNKWAVSWTITPGKV